MIKRLIDWIGSHEVYINDKMMEIMVTFIFIAFGGLLALVIYGIVFMVTNYR